MAETEKNRVFVQALDIDGIYQLYKNLNRNMLAKIVSVSLQIYEKRQTDDRDSKMKHLITQTLYYYYFFYFYYDAGLPDEC